MANMEKRLLQLGNHDHRILAFDVIQTCFCCHFGCLWHALGFTSLPFNVSKFDSENSQNLTEYGMIRKSAIHSENE
jgi:hypothetical protein